MLRGAGRGVDRSRMRTAFAFLLLSVAFVGIPSAASAAEIVIYSEDIPASAMHGSWALVADPTAAGGHKLATTDAGFATISAPLASPTHYVDVPFAATAATTYAVWFRV